MNDYKYTDAEERRRDPDNPFFDDIPKVVVPAKGIALGDYQFTCVLHGHCPRILCGGSVGKGTFADKFGASYRRSRAALERRVKDATGIEARWITNPRAPRSGKMRVWCNPDGQRVRLVFNN